MRKSFKKALSLVLSAAMTLTMGTGISPKAVGAEEAAATGSYSKDTPIVARIGYEMEGSYDYRTTSNVKQEAIGKAYAEWLKAQKKDVPEYGNYFLFMNGNGVDVNDKTGSWTTKSIKDENGDPIKDEETGKKKKFITPEVCDMYEGAEVTDQVLDKDGEYTVKIDKLNLQDAYPSKADGGKDGAASKSFNMLYVGINAPTANANNANVKATAVSVKIDGKEVASDVDMPQKGDNEDGIFQFMIANSYKNEKDSTTAFEDGKEGNNSKLETVPKESIEITFKVEGIDYASGGYSWPEFNIPVDAAPVEETPEAIATVTAPPEKTLSKAFDIYLAANVNPALTPNDANARKDAGGNTIQAAVFSDEGFKSKIDAAKNAKGEALFDPTKQDWIASSGSSLTISKTGIYELTVTARGDCDDLAGGSGNGNSGAIWMPLLVDGSNGVMPKDYNLVGSTIKVGDTPYNWPARLIQDSESSVRLSVVNKWAKDSEKAVANPVSATIPVSKGDKITFTFMVTPDAPAPMPTATPAAISTKAATSYDAYLGFQTDAWVFRNTTNDKDYGLASTKLNFKTEVGYWSKNDQNNVQRKPITSTDAKMTENGVQYKVGISGLNLQTLKGTHADDVVSKAFNMLFVTTTIPLGMKGVTMNNAKLLIDGNVVKEYTVVPCKGDAEVYYQFMLADGYAPSDGTKDAAYPSGDLLKVLPTSTMEVTYTMTGIDFDRATVGPAKGKTFQKGAFKYKVLTESVRTGEKVTKGTAQVVGLSKSGKKKASVSLGATAKGTATTASGTSVGTYKVTKIKAKAFKGASKLKKANFKKATNVKVLGANAFANCKKLTAVTFGKKITKIQKGTFKGCKKLSKLTFSAKLKSVNKTAFKGCKKKIKIAGAKKAANKKKIKKVYKKVK